MVTTLNAAGDLALEPVSSLQLDASIGPLSLALTEILRRRRTERAFSGAPLPSMQLSRLLWAACGCNGPQAPQRTAPKAGGALGMDLYLAMENGLYRFAPEPMQLVKVADQDLRALTGQHPCVRSAPLSLIYVATLDPAQALDPVPGALSIGHISQNVYLFCAAEGLAAYAHTDFNADALVEAMGLAPQQRILLTQTVGQPETARAPAGQGYDE